MDVVILYDKNGSNREFYAEQAAKNLCKLLSRYIRIQCGENYTRAAIVESFHTDFDGYGSELNTLREAFERSTYIFILVTKSLSDQMREHGVNREIFLLQDELLVKSFKEKDRRNCVIPLYTMSRNEAKRCGFEMPAGLTSVVGIEIYDFINGHAIDAVLPEDISREHLNHDIL